MNHECVVRVIRFDKALVSATAPQVNVGVGETPVEPVAGETRVGAGNAVENDHIAELAS